MRFNVTKPIENLEDVKKFNKHCFNRWGGSFHPDDFETYHELEKGHHKRKIKLKFFYMRRYRDCEELDENFFWNDLLNLSRLDFFKRVGKENYF